MDKITKTAALPESAREFGFYVDGAWRGGRPLFERLSPGHGVPVTLIPKCTVEDLNEAVAAARRAFEDRSWAGLSGADRAGVLLRAAAILRERRDEIAYWEVLENGKPIAQARGEIEHCIACFEMAAGVARTLHGDSYNSLGDNLFGLVLREPVGVVGLITPWNFPFLLLCERVPFILASGCTIVAKPSEVTSATTLILAEVLEQAGLPAGVYNVVTGSGRVIGQAMAEHPDIDMLSFTGSTAVGRSCVHAAADSNFKKLGLELGGKNPFIVFADANIDDAVDAVAFGISFNTGQCCVSSSRLIVERSIAAEFERKLAEKMARIRIGDPLDEETQVGAITTDAQNDTILGFIAKGREEGATLVTGGNTLEIGGGRYIAPTLFSGVGRDMEIAREEIFGPVLSSFHFDTLEEAIEIANDTIYGLAASVWSQNIETALTVSRRVRAGRFWVNTIMAGGPEMPLGGFKQSGWGREAGVYGVEEYTQIKSVHIEFGNRAHWIK
ncbi:aldehyde dehydrogenase family protein [Paenirhodobacter populi]|uniref:Aldehyde dehydrogenase family protein n=1 Tax=Paenirhodobacter populi TaxID=2306993 RepID=A0A443JBH1_9RHOB|nr:aldehyde dehydrogenase family protein [Sinirhodobacter populi]RWR17899.1 aldehyde dehydrogenase family protein [Sinirhodobacter populi]